MLLGHIIVEYHAKTTPLPQTKEYCITFVCMGVDPGGMGGGIYPPNISGGGDGLYNHPPNNSP